MSVNIFLCEYSIICKKENKKISLDKKGRQNASIEHMGPKIGYEDNCFTSFNSVMYFGFLFVCLFGFSTKIYFKKSNC